MCDFALTKRNDLGKAFANIYLLSVPSQGGITQTVPKNATIKFNGHGKLSSVAWLTSDTLTMLKNGTFKIDFIINYTTPANSNAQVALFVNDENVGGAFGSSNILPSGVKQLSGSYTLKLSKDDYIQLKSVGNTFIIRQAGPTNEFLVNLTLTEI
ncbi:hypothetical protein QKU48_gp1127 [Fadolivirus algeromassiliense]|jgi:hypothetical protein|uniref:Uncharacterized protein n=1 Tax=Fadolivirus FV1/VV64 TaxID=3070911 RepID=A0A7D3QUZ1_9VIRU|nr:hypothetical protein QKU48_gp1127 [Fadolivirus algeromassiliense]QKF94585.1 hypothetical protein Fadolivirus_1_1127 [Fadolivirus FV1/VV64]